MYLVMRDSAERGKAVQLNMVAVCYSRVREVSGPEFLVSSSRVRGFKSGGILEVLMPSGSIPCD